MANKNIRFGLRAAALLTLVLAGLLTAASCVREEIHDEAARTGIASDQAILSFSVTDPGVELTKSQITAPGFDTGIQSVFILLVGSDGQWKKCYSSSGNSGLTEFTIKADGSTYYDVYALVNMGNINVGGSTAPSIPISGGAVHPEDLVYTLPSTFSSLGSTGLPMCGYTRLAASSITPGAVNDVSVTLRRLLSKVVVTINKSSMFSGSSDGSALAGGQLKVAQAAKVLRPFAAEGSRRALSASEIYTSSTDWHDFTVSDGQSLVSSQVVLYVPENRQGNGGASATQAGKTPASGRASLCTYLEYTADKDGGSDGVDGGMTYRVYLGEDETRSFDVIGDKIYNATLSLSWNGMWEGAWRVVTSSFSDTRALVISATENSSTGIVSSADEAVRVRKNAATAFYLNYFINGSSSPSHGRKDLENWPYGWYLYLDGVETPISGTSGTISWGTTNLFSWTYNSSNDLLSLQAAPTCPSGSLHTLQLRTIDGRRSSNLVYFTSTVPYDFGWVGNIAPDHVAQTNTLKAVDPDTGETDATGEFHLRSSYAGFVGLDDHGDGTATVSLLKPFDNISDAIYIIERGTADDRHCDVPLGSRLPHASCTDLWTTYVDASENLKYTYYASVIDGTNSDAVGSAFTVTSDGSVPHCGEYLDYALVESLIPPVLTSTNGKLGYVRSLGADGVYQLKTYIATYSGLIPSGTSFDVDIAQVKMSNYETRDAKTGMVYRAWNPWKNVTSIEHSTTVYNDYTLYKEPNITSPYIGWETSPHNAPTETQDDVTLHLQNPVVMSASNVTFNTQWQAATSYFLGNIATGTPGKCAADFAANKWTLWLDILDHDHFDKDRTYNYLFGRGLYFVDTYDMIDYLSASDWRIAIGSAYATQADAYSDTPFPTQPDISGERSYGIQGVQFTAQANSDFSTWAFTYGMKGRTAENLQTHNAGKFNVVLQVVNPYDPTGERLSQIVADAYMRLHIYVTTKVTAGPEIHTTEGPGASYGQYWTYGCNAITTTSDYIPGLSGILEVKEFIEPSSEINSSISQGFFSGGGAGMRRINVISPIYFSFRNQSAFNNMTDAEAKRGLRNALASSGTSPFTFKTNSELNNELGTNTFYREDAVTLWYDWTSTGTYSYGSSTDNRRRLFVIHLFPGTWGVDRQCYYFDSSWNL